MEGKDFKERKNYEKGKELFKDGRLREASQYYLQAIKQAYIPQEAAIKLAVCAGLGESFRILRQFAKSQHFFEMGMRLAGSAQVKELQYKDDIWNDLIEEKYSLLTNYSLLQADKLEEPRQTRWMWSEFKKIQDSALSKLKEAREISNEFLIEVQRKLRRAQKYGMIPSKKWQVQYMKNLVNIIGVLEAQASQFNCPQVYKLIIEIVSKGQQFVKNHIENKDLQKFIHKSYYFKGISYARLGNLQQAYKYLKNDYDYCTRKQETQDRNFTANFLVQMLGSNQKYDQAFKFAYKEQLKNKVNIFKQYSSQYLQKIQNVKDKSKHIREREKQIRQLFQALDEMGKSKDGFQKIKKAIQEQSDILVGQCQIKLSHKQFYGFLFAYAKWLYKNKNFQKAYKYYEKSVQYVNRQTKQQLQGIKLKLLIQGNLYSDKQIVTKMYQEAIKKAKKINYYVQKLQANLKRYIQQQLRKQDFWRKTVKHILGIQQSQMVDEEGVLLDNPNNIGRGLKMGVDGKKKEQAKDLHKIYLQRCKQQNIVPRVPIQKRLPERSENVHFPFEQFFNLPQNQVILLIKLFDSFQIFDFRQHRMTQSIIQAISDKIVDVQFLGLGKGMKTKLFGELLNKPMLLKVLKVRYYQKFQFFKSQTIVSMLRNPGQLRVLSLKGCLLKDKDINYMGIQRLTSLESLSLADNELNGHFCKVLGDLEHLQKLNMSGNPLFQFSVAPKSLKILKLQRMKGLPNTPQSEQHFFDMMNSINLQKLVISSNQESLLIRFLSNLCDYCVTKEVHFERLKEITCTQVQVNEKLFWEVLRRIVLNNRALRKLNLNNLTANQQQFEQFTKFIKLQIPNLTLQCKDFINLDMMPQMAQANQENDY